MANHVSYACDGCGDDIGRGALTDAAQLMVVSSDGIPKVLYLCTKPEFKEQDPTEVQPRGSFGPMMPKYTGCVRKVLTKSVLSTLYSEVAEYVGNEDDKPFPL